MKKKTKHRYEIARRKERVWDAGGFNYRARLPYGGVTIVRAHVPRRREPGRLGQQRLQPLVAERVGGILQGVPFGVGIVEAAAEAQAQGKPLDALKRWALQVQARTCHNKAACALANKLARICYACLRDKVPYQAKMV